MDEGYSWDVRIILAWRRARYLWLNRVVYPLTAQCPECHLHRPRRKSKRAPGNRGYHQMSCYWATRDSWG